MRNSLLNKINRKAVAIMAVAMLSAPAFATDPVLPTTGVDVPAYITVAITSLGAVAAVAVGGFFAFKVIKKGLSWANRIG